MTIKERRKDWLYPLGLFLLALTLRLVFLAQITGLPYFETLFLDAQSYDAKARAILGGDWLGTKIFYQDPFYPYFLALVYKVFGPAPAAVRMVQLILGAFGPVLAYLVGRLLADRRTGILAGLFFIAYGLFYFYDGIIGKDGPGLILVMLALAALLGAAFKQRVWFWLPAGACFGLAALTRGNLLLLAPLFALWIIFAFKDSLKSRLIRVVLLALGIILVISPVTIRNWVVGRDLVLLTSQAGQNFYIGNNPRAGGFFEHPDRIRLNPRFEEEDFRQEALRLTGRRDMKASEISNFWMAQGLKYAKENPARTLQLLGIKAAMFFNDFEIPDNYNYYFVREKAWLLKLLGLTFGLIAPFGLAGIVILWPDRRRFFIPAIFSLGYFISIVPFHMASRYRLPIVPLLLCTASVTIWWLVDRVKEKNWRAVIKALIPMALILVFCYWPFYSKDETFDAPYTALGVAAARTGDHEKAVEYYRRALEVNPDYAPARYNLGNAYLALNRLNLAQTEFARAIKTDRHLIQAHLNLGNTYLISRRFGRAEEIFKQALRDNPRSASAYLGLGLSLLYQKRFAQAEKSFERALEINPKLAQAHYNLACALAQLGRTNQAWPHLEEAARLDPVLVRQAPADRDLRPLGPPNEIRRRLGIR